MHSPSHASTSKTVDERARVGSAPSPKSRDTRRWWILALLSAAQFMLVIDVTVVNVALPSIGRDLALDRTQLTWVVTAYTLLFGSLLVLGGRLADTFGRRRMFLTGLGVFVLASLASGLAPTGDALIVSRMLQGVAAAILSPAALSLVTTTFAGSERNRALAVWAAIGGAGGAVGVIVGGALASGPGWPWIFFVNVPVGVVVAIGIAREVAPGATWRSGEALDLLGALAFALGVGSLLWAVIDAGDLGWTSPATLSRLGIAVVFLAGFVVRERTGRQPLVRIELLADRAFAGAVGLMLAGSVVLGGMVFLDTFYLQLVARFSAIETGLVFLPMALALIGGSQWAAFYIGHHGQRGSAAIGFLAAGLGMAYLSGLPETGDVLLGVVPGLILGGFGVGAVLVSATTTAFGRVSESEAGRASGFVNTSHELGLSLGAALGSSIGGLSLGGVAGAGGAFGSAFLAFVVVALMGVAAARLVLPTKAASARASFAH